MAAYSFTSCCSTSEFFSRGALGLSCSLVGPGWNPFQSWCFHRGFGIFYFRLRVFPPSSLTSSLLSSAIHRMAHQFAFLNLSIRAELFVPSPSRFGDCPHPQGRLPFLVCCTCCFHQRLYILHQCSIILNIVITVLMAIIL